MIKNKELSLKTSLDETQKEAWKRESFFKIAELCGGLVEVDKKTEQLQVLIQARIKVGRTAHLFIPASINIKEGDKKIEVKLRPLSRAPWDSFRNFQCSCKEEDDDVAKEKTCGRRGGKSAARFQNGAKFKTHGKDIWRAKQVLRDELNEVVVERSGNSREQEKLTSNVKETDNVGKREKRGWAAYDRLVKGLGSDVCGLPIAKNYNRGKEETGEKGAGNGLHDKRGPFSYE